MTRRPIHVLVVGTDPSAVGDATVALASTGHTVSHVTPESKTPFAWTDAEDRSVDTDQIDVVLSIPGHALAGVPWCEYSVMDLVRRGVPLVLAGTPFASPFTAWATRYVDLGENVVEVCEDVVHHPGRDHPDDIGDRPTDVQLIDLDMRGGETLSRRHCLDLLGTATVGRVALTLGALPVVVPVDYRLWQEHIVFRTEADSRLDTAARDAVVAFEVDALGPSHPWGWSVMVTGLATDVSETSAASEIEFSPTGWWVTGGKDHLIAVATDIVAGRRLHSRSHSPSPSPSQSGTASDGPA